MLRGHSSDVLDLSWSPDRKYLASCSVDNSIVIWNAKDLPQKVSIIEGHCGLVKGLTWDPVGKFVASQSDDRSIRIWRTSDWKETKVITEPFKNCSGTTHVLRLSWSPDGKYIVSAHALNNDGPTAQIIERGTDWKIGMDFVGHRKAVEVVLFNPHLFAMSGSKDNHGCVALGSKDRSLSVWLTNHKRPLLVLHDLFNDSILDLSWSDDGYELLVCSTDGSVAYLSFSSKELGRRLSKQALDDLYVRTYGFKRAEIKSNDSSMVLIENPELLKLHTGGTGGATPGKLAGNDSVLSTVSKEDSFNQSAIIVSTSAKSSAVVTTKQVETRTKEGKRRITPITLTTEPSSISRAPLPFTSFSPKQNKGGVVKTTPERQAQSNKSTSSGSEHSTPKSCAELPDERTTPPKPISFEALSPKTLQDPLTGTVTPLKDTTVPSVSPKPGSAAKKRPAEEQSTEPIVLLKAKKLKLKQRKGVNLGSPAVHSPKPSTPQKHSSLQALARHGTFAHLPAPKVEPSFSIVLFNARNRDAENGASLEVENNQDTAQYSLALTKPSGKVWTVSLASPCLVAAANSHIACVACQDKSLSVFSSQTGRLLLGKLFLPDLCYELKTESHFLMAVLCSAEVFVWDTQSMKVLIRNASFSHLLPATGSKQQQQQGQALGKTTLSRNGRPVVKIGANCFVFNTDMHSWMELGSERESSEIQPANLALTSDLLGSSAPLDLLQKSLHTSLSGIAPHSHHGSGMSAQSSTLSYLESQISRSQCISSPAEYKHWAKAYVQFLVKNTLEDRLREFCGQFYGPNGLGGALSGLGGAPSGLGGAPSGLGGAPSGLGGAPSGLGGAPSGLGGAPSGLGGAPSGLGGTPSGLGGAPSGLGGARGEMVLGIGKLSLLREMMVIIAKNHKLQRLYSELKEALDRT